MSIKTLHARLALAYEEQANRKAEFFDAAEVTTHAKRDLKLARQRIIAENAADPKALGSNEAAREATIAEMTATLAAQVEGAEDAERKARNALELAADEVAACRALLRCLELIAAEREEAIA